VEENESDDNDSFQKEKNEDKNLKSEENFSKE